MMSTSDEPARSPKPEKGRAWYFEIWLAPHDAREALERIKIGAYAGYAFAISYALGAIMFFFGGNPSGPKLATADDYFWSGVVGVFAALIIGALAALSQRRPGVVIPAGLLLWFTLEVLAKIGSGKTNAGWLVAYYAIGVSFVAAIRGARFLRKKSPEWRQSA